MHPRADQNREVTEWLTRLLMRGARIVIPEIADYELRRELLRAGKTESVQRLDALAERVDYLALTTPAMRMAAELWAMVRRAGRPTADDKALDGDAILAAQAATADIAAEDEPVIATDNVGHLERFTIPAKRWTEVS